MRVLKGAEREVSDLAFSPDGRAIAAGFDEHYPIYLWNLEAFPLAAARLSTEGGYERGLQFSVEGRALSWRNSSGFRSFDRDTLDYSDQAFRLSGVTRGVVASADGMRIVSDHGMPEYCLIGWRLSDESEWIRTWTVSTADLAVERLTLSADGLQFAMIARDGLGDRWMENPRRVEVRDGTTGRVLSVGNYPYNYAPELRFSPDARQLVGVNDMTLFVWDAANPGDPRLVRNDNRKDFTAAAFHPSGRYLFATSNDETVHVFDTASWERVTRFTWQIGKLKAIAVCPHGTLAAAGSDRGDIVIWDVDL